MNSKRYADMTTIMQFCRIFSEQMYLCMRNSGMLKEGYKLTINVGRWDGLTEDSILTSQVALEKQILNNDPDYDTTRMEQFKFSGREWRVYDDPIAEAGSLPPEVHIKAEGWTGRTANGAETARKPGKSDGMWFSASDNDPPMGCGVSIDDLDGC